MGSSKPERRHARACIDPARAVELTETLRLIAGDPANQLGRSWPESAHPPTARMALRADLDRFTFLLGGNDGEFLLGEDAPCLPRPPSRRLRQPGPLPGYGRGNLPRLSSREPG